MSSVALNKGSIFSWYLSRIRLLMKFKNAYAAASLCLHCSECKAFHNLTPATTSVPSVSAAFSWD
jgi:hypothetical protein